MKFRELAASAAAVMLSTVPAFAQGEVSRASAKAGNVNQMDGGGTLLLILAILLIGLGVALAAGNKSDKPASP